MRKGLERNIDQYSLPHKKETETMSRLTVIDLTKMSEQGRMYYLQDLLQDATECIQDLTDNKVQYGYVQAILNHATQAVLDLEKLTKEGK